MTTLSILASPYPNKSSAGLTLSTPLHPSSSASPTTIPNSTPRSILKRRIESPIVQVDDQTATTAPFSFSSPPGVGSGGTTASTGSSSGQKSIRLAIPKKRKIQLEGDVSTSGIVPDDHEETPATSSTAIKLAFPSTFGPSSPDFDVFDLEPMSEVTKDYFTGSPPPRSELTLLPPGKRLNKPALGHLRPGEVAQAILAARKESHPQSQRLTTVEIKAIARNRSGPVHSRYATVLASTKRVGSQPPVTNSTSVDVARRGATKFIVSKNRHLILPLNKPQQQAPQRPLTLKESDLLSRLEESNKQFTRMAEDEQAEEAEALEKALKAEAMESGLQEVEFPRIDCPDTYVKRLIHVTPSSPPPKPTVERSATPSPSNQSTTSSTSASDAEEEEEETTPEGVAVAQAEVDADGDALMSPLAGSTTPSDLHTPAKAEAPLIPSSSSPLLQAPKKRRETPVSPAKAHPNLQSPIASSAPTPDTSILDTPQPAAAAPLVNDSMEVDPPLVAARPRGSLTHRTGVRRSLLPDMKEVEPIVVGGEEMNVTPTAPVAVSSAQPSPARITIPPTTAPVIAEGLSPVQALLATIRADAILHNGLIYVPLDTSALLAKTTAVAATPSIAPKVNSTLDSTPTATVRMDDDSKSANAEVATLAAITTPITPPTTAIPADMAAPVEPEVTIPESPTPMEGVEATATVSTISAQATPIPSASSSTVPAAAAAATSKSSLTTTAAAIKPQVTIPARPRSHFALEFSPEKPEKPAKRGRGRKPHTRPVHIDTSRTTAPIQRISVSPVITPVMLPTVSPVVPHPMQSLPTVANPSSISQTIPIAPVSLPMAPPAAQSELTSISASIPIVSVAPVTLPSPSSSSVEVAPVQTPAQPMAASNVMPESTKIVTPPIAPVIAASQPPSSIPTVEPLVSTTAIAPKVKRNHVPKELRGLTDALSVHDADMKPRSISGPNQEEVKSVQNAKKSRKLVLDEVITPKPSTRISKVAAPSRTSSTTSSLARTLPQCDNCQTAYQSSKQLFCLNKHCELCPAYVAPYNRRNTNGPIAVTTAPTATTAAAPSATESQFDTVVRMVNERLGLVAPAPLNSSEPSRNSISFVATPHQRCPECFTYQSPRQIFCLNKLCSLCPAFIPPSSRRNTGATRKGSNSTEVKKVDQIAAAAAATNSPVSKIAEADVELLVSLPVTTPMPDIPATTTTTTSSATANSKKRKIRSEVSGLFDSLTVQFVPASKKNSEQDDDEEESESTRRTKRMARALALSPTKNKSVATLLTKLK